MAKPTKIILDKQSDLILTNARIVGPSGIVKSDLPGLVDDLSTLQSHIDVEKGRIDAILAGSTADLDQFVEIVNFVNGIDYTNDQSLLTAVNNLNDSIDAEESRAMSAEAALSSDLSDLQSYVDTTVDSAISSLTADLSSETAARISDVNSEESRAIAAESSLSAKLSVETAARISDVDAEESRATAAELSLESDITTERLRIDAILAGSTADLDQFVEIVNFVNDIDYTNDQSLLTAVNNLNDSIDAEESRATAAELSLTTKLSVETAARISDVDAEESRATAAESSLDVKLSIEIAARESAISAEHSHHVAAEASLDAKLSVETAARISDVDAEESRATAAELSLTTSLSVESSRAIAAETTLQSHIDVEKGRIDAILAGSTADLDQFVEIVNFVNGIDYTNDQSLLTAVNNLNNAIDAEATARFDADNQLSSDLSDLQSYVDTTVDSAISTLTADLSSETAARISDVDAEEAARVAADASLTTALAAEKLRAEGAESSIATALAAEHSHHTLAELSLTTRLSVEESRATAAELSLTQSISAEHSHHTLAEESLDAKLSVETSRATAAETQLGINIEEEESRAIAAELSLTERLSTEESRATAAELSLTESISVEHSHHTLAEESLTTRLSTEESRATAAELSLETDITTERLRIDAILAGSTADLDTFVEVVNFINGIDLNNDQELFSQLTQINQSIQAEIDRATASENNISDVVDGVDARVSTLEDTVAQLPLTDGTTLEYNSENNTIRLREYVAAPASNIRTFDGLMKATSLPENLEGFDNYTYTTKGYVFNLVDGESARAIDAETDLDNRLSDAEDQIGNLSSQLQALPETDNQTIEVNNNNNTIRLTEVVGSPESGVRTFQGAIKVEQLPENNGTFDDYSFITRTYVNTSLGNEVNRALEAEADLANMITNVSSNIDELTTYFEAIPGVDGSTIDIDTTTNNIRLAADVAAPASGIRTFSGLINVASEPSVDANFGDLSLVTKGWVINQVGGDFQMALDAEISARIAADSSLDVRVNDIISNTDFTQIDSFTEIVSELSLEIARAEDAEMSLANDLSDLQLYVDTTVDSAISELTADLSVETSRATAAEASLAADFANIYTQKVTVSGTPNGTLTTFTLLVPVRIGSEMIYVNGLLMEEGEDYTNVYTNGKVSAVEFFVAPIAEMKVRAYGVCSSFYE